MKKNQVIYQLTRHAITHYKKPFKGDYSLAIPTNLYVTDLFLKTRAQSTSNLSLIEKHNVTIKNKIQIKPANDSSAQQSSANQALQTINKDSHLQISQRKSNFAPPSTSPFTVLLLKEEKKLKPNKIVEEFPWTGLPGEQLATKPRTSYSVRAKVAMLAELALLNAALAVTCPALAEAKAATEIKLAAAPIVSAYELAPIPILYARTLAELAFSKAALA